MAEIPCQVKVEAGEKVKVVIAENVKTEAEEKVKNEVIDQVVKDCEENVVNVCEDKEVDVATAEKEEDQKRNPLVCNFEKALAAKMEIMDMSYEVIQDILLVRFVYMVFIKLSKMPISHLYQRHAKSTNEALKKNGVKYYVKLNDALKENDQMK